jgi:ParB-like nuclease family protein
LSGNGIIQAQYRAIDELVPYSKNARTHDDTQVSKLAALIDQFGWTNPVLADAEGIVAGHGRVLAARKLYADGKTLRRPDGQPIPQGSVPVIDCSGWDKPQRQAYILADNRSALDAGWDSAMLQSELQELKADGFELGLTGFETLELDAVLAGLAQVGPQGSGIALPGDVKEAEDSVLISVRLFGVKEIAKEIISAWPKANSPADLVAGVITPAMAMAQFNALASGADGTTGYWISALFNPQRLSTVCAGRKLSYFSANDDSKFKRVGARFFSEQDPKGGNVHPTVFPKYAGVGWQGVNVAFEFRPALARKIYLKHCAAGARVLDPCHGWGGRVVGWLAANLAGHYVGYDPATDTAAGWKKCVEFLKKSSAVSTAENFCQPFEDAQLEPESFDFAFTSPPYFDTEQYAGAESSFRRYATFDKWVLGFYKPLLSKTIAALKPGCKFVLNVGNKLYPLSKTATELAPTLGCDVSSEAFGYIGRAGLVGSLGNTDGEDFLTLTKRKLP